MGLRTTNSHIFRSKNKKNRIIINNLLCVQRNETNFINQKIKIHYIDVKGEMTKYITISIIYN